MRVSSGVVPWIPVNTDIKMAGGTAKNKAVL